MKQFITDDFLLSNETARTLYHDFAASQPIIDYHNHLPAAEIAGDRRFRNLTQAWLEGDHYKWRAMRTLGIDESYITGNASDEEKFGKWAYTVPYTVRNPLYHWTHLELKNYFGVSELLGAETAESIYSRCSELLQEPGFTARGLLKKMNVELLCTTDDPADSLEHHRELQEEPFEIRVLPAFRPDRAYDFGDPEAYNEYLDRLQEAADLEISGFDNLMDALYKRIDYFHELGCRLSDHGLQRLYLDAAAKKRIDSFFKKIRGGDPLDASEQRSLTCAILLELARKYHEKGWAQQYHIGALRNTNDRMMQKLGSDAGFDSIGDFRHAEGMAGFLNELDSTNQLAKTILYNLNPADNELFATMAGNFNDGTVRGKIQYGSAWWFLDQKEGIENQLNALSNMNLLSCFIGMLTDSRSFLSYPRHEYFRRVLCNLIGSDVEQGLLPRDIDWLGKIVTDICYNNAKRYFEFQT